jgi:AcrR family transcriptional regulator
MAVERLTPTRRRELTRRNLLEAAAVVFAREGFHGASLDEIAAEAGFTKGAVYSNFKSKDDLFVALLEDRMEHNIAAAEVARAADAAEGGDVANIRDVMLHPPMWDRAWMLLYLEFVLYASRNPAARDRLARNIRRSHDEAVRMMRDELDRKGINSQLPVDELATISLSVFEGLSLMNVVEPSLMTPDTIDATLKFLMAAMPALDAGTDATP